MGYTNADHISSDFRLDVCCSKSVFFQFESFSYKCAVMEQFFTDKAYIDGKWVDAGTTFPVTNPYDGKVVTNVADCGEAHARNAIASAKAAFKTWKKTTGKDRYNILLKWNDLMMEHKQALAALLSAENGKPIKESLGEINYAAGFVVWVAEEARRTYGMTIPSNNTAKRMMSIKQPIGVAAMITPWNFPSAMVTRKACAAIAAGCSVVLKPSEETPLSALALAFLAEKAGLPAGVLNIVPCSRNNVQAVGQVLSEHPDVMALSFTGSTAVGKLLLKNAASTVKKVSLELGGHAPFVVFSSADVDRAVQHTMYSKFRYMGQTCVCANRIYVQSSIHEVYVEKLVAKVKEELKSGDPQDPNTTYGPLINEKAVEKVHGHVEDAVKQGARVALGGARSALGSTFYEPTVLVGVTTAMRCYTEETFGPVAPIIKFETEEELLSMVNQSDYGLAGYFFSNDVSQCWRIAEAVETGMIGINEGLTSTPEAPFGGVKHSGLGREGSVDGLGEFMETKYICWGI